MMDLTVKETAEAVKGRIKGEETLSKRICGVSTDSREDSSGKLFIAIKGPRFDAHDYIEDALSRGAVAAISERAEEPGGASGAIIYVESTMKALADLAEHCRGLFRGRVAAITGSAGKTTTKDLTASVLSQRYRTLKSEGNLNNEIGLPKMAFKLDKSHEAAVFEMGMNHAGEIGRLSKIARPDICVITNVGTAHIENFGSQQGILAAKAEIFDFMSPGGVAVLNGDDPYLASLRGDPRLEGGKTIFYGLNSGELRAENVEDLGIEGMLCDITGQGMSFKARIPLPGMHMVYNALAAAAVGLEMGLGAQEIQNGIESFAPSKNRMEISRAKFGTIINDSYNANPASMEAALEVLANSKEGRKIAVLGGMFELGVHAKELHERVGRKAAQVGVDILICVGELAQHIRSAYEKETLHGKALSFETNQECLERIEGILETGDVILVKASRAVGLESVAEKLKSL
ncbi:MAG: UDP-N-acetylmuramoyl-tripeptide--D-alanyl-D-alanine ligase [Clostridiales bacterium]|nr:UDP-N-acetylmuramoyl-tripeptide--D-alanyl-D-alanine ligase [Clostridiales bacterium]